MAMEGIMGSESSKGNTKRNDLEWAALENHTELHERLLDKVVFPHVEAGMKLYSKEYPDDPENIEIVRDLLDSFMEQFRFLRLAS